MTTELKRIQLSDVARREPKVAGSHGRDPRRRGFVLIAVLAALFVVMLLAASVVQSLLIHHRQTRDLEHQLQAMWLTESAVERAVDALATSSEYRGETWTMPETLLVDAQSAIAIIEVDPPSAPESGHRVVVKATYQPNAVQRIAHRRELVVYLDGPGGS